jgi:putative sigma-54 modulation protein
MNIVFTGKHADVSEATRDYAQAKLQKLDRFFDHVQEVHVVASTLRGQVIIEVTVKAGNTLIRAEERAGDATTAVDLVVGKLERQLKRYKERLQTRTRESLEGHKPAEVAPPAEPVLTPAPTEEESLPQIVRTKRFAVKPMDPTEAAMEMDLIGHDFFVFLNCESDQVNVVYKRRDGNFGLIEPSV